MAAAGRRQINGSVRHWPTASGKSLKPKDRGARAGPPTRAERRLLPAVPVALCDGNIDRGDLHTGPLDGTGTPC